MAARRSGSCFKKTVITGAVLPDAKTIALTNAITKLTEEKPVGI